MIGIDILKLSRVESLLKKERFLDKFFTENEKKYIHDRNFSLNTIAGLIATKESVSKAFGVGISKELGLLDIEVLHDKKNAPFINVNNEKIKKIIYEQNIKSINISITHDGEYAISICELESKNKEKELKVNKNKFSLPIRKKDSHKYDYGKILIIGGSKGMTGSVVLASKAALRSGAGMVYILVPKCIRNIVESKTLEQIVLDLNDEGLKEFGQFEREDLLNIIHTMSCIAIGPGIGKGIYAKNILEIVLNNFDGPIIVDADAISMMTEFEDLMNKNIYLTPHTKEFSDLSEFTVNEINYDRMMAVCNYLDRNDVNILLKGHNSIVANNEEYYINETGNNGMATAGSGDVLTGIASAFLALDNNFELFKTAVFVHGLAGDLASNCYGKTSMIASDIIEFLPKAIGEINDK